MTTLIIPGLNNSGPGHWQTWFEAQVPGSIRVNQSDWHRPELARWSQTVRRHLSTCEEEIWLVAHSFGALATAQAAWDYRDQIAGALLVAPADPDKFGIADLLPNRDLGFPSILVASSNDPWMTAEKADHWADVWGSLLVNLGSVGHINEQSGYSPWPLGLDIFNYMRESLRLHWTRRARGRSRRQALPTANLP